MTEAGQGHWRYLLLHQPVWEQVMQQGVPMTVGELERRLKG